MLILLSPAKTLDFESSSGQKQMTQPEFTDRSQAVMNALCKKSVKKLMDLQNISRDLAELNYRRNREWSEDHSGGGNLRPAVYAFRGDVYRGLRAEEWDAEDLEFAEKHLRILSGLYGILRPLDAIRPYRLEMGTPLKVGRKKNLYEVWRNTVAEHIAAHESEFILNLASNEYFKAVDAKKAGLPVVNVDFKDLKGGGYKTVAFWAKKARGMMARFAVKNKLQKMDDLRAFQEDGYYFSADKSKDRNFVFLRDHE